MRVDVALATELVSTPVPASRSVVVIDVIRAMTCVTAALAAGATGVVPVAGVDEARRRAAAEGALLTGERGGLPPDGFDLGNSPSAFTAAACRDRSVVMTTTNGTRAVERCRGAGLILAGALVNAEACCRVLEERSAEDVLLLCAGSGGAVCADDVAAAGCMMGMLALRSAAEPTDAARVAAALFDAWRHDLRGLLVRSLSGRKLAAVDLVDDIGDCVAVDSVPVVGALDSDGIFRKLGGS